MARILHNNRVKFPKDFFSIVLYTNMAAMTSSENHQIVTTSRTAAHLVALETAGNKTANAEKSSITNVYI